MIISAYIAEHSFKGLREGDAQRLTHVNFAFALVKDGKGSVDHWTNGKGIKDFNRNKGHIKSVLSVGGWGAGGFSPAVATPHGRELLASTLVDIAEDYGFDGIDLDWEYPGDDVAGIEASPDDKANYTVFVELLRRKMAPGKILSMAAGGMQSCVDNLELDKLLHVMDFINLMTYDMCPWDRVNYHTALYQSEAGSNSCDNVVAMYEAAGVPRERLTLGAAFYARIYKDVNGLNDKVGGAPGFINGGYKETMKRVEASGLQYDEKAQAPYVYDAKAREFITFDNPRSLAAKMEYVQATGLGGIMFWEYSCDDEDSTLLKAMAGAKG